MKPAKPKFSISRSIGLVLLLALCLCAVFGPALVGKDPAKQSLLEARMPPSKEHLLGTDHLGRDMAARLLSGAQISLLLSLLSVVTAAVPGIALGILASWYGGWCEKLLTGLSLMILALPGLLLVLMLASISPGSWWTLYVGISLTLWVEYFRYTKERVRIILAQTAVEASRLLGFSAMWICRRHIFPEIGSGLMTIASFGTATAVVAIAALGFVSLGVRPPTAEWGLMMTELLPYWREAPFLILQPILCLVLTVLSLHLCVGSFHQKR